MNPRAVANFIETRAAVAEYVSKSDRLTLHVGSQGVYGIQRAIAHDVLKSKKDRLRVTTGDVGGGFGTKIFVYREYPLLLEAAERLGRPVVIAGPRFRLADRELHQGCENQTVLLKELAAAAHVLDPVGGSAALRFRQALEEETPRAPEV